MKRIVELIAEDNRYKDTPYPFRCIYDDSINTYLTGQHIDPRIPETENNLTTDEMTGKATIPAEKRKRFPFVINPDGRINLQNRDKYDLTKDENGKVINAKDAAMYNLVLNHTWFISKDRASYMPRKHYFYLKDPIAEAEVRVKKSEQSYEAEKYVREALTDEGLFDTALLLSYKVSGFHFDTKEKNVILVKDSILNLCKENPEAILETKEKGSQEDLFILKLALHGIVTRRGTDFYDGSRYLGGDLKAVKKEMKLEENTALVSKWSRLLSEIEGRVPGKTESSNKKEELYSQIQDMNLDELKKFAGSKRYPKAEWGEIETVEKLISYLLNKVS